MRFRTLANNLVNIPLAQYKINWRKPSLSKFQTRIKSFFWKYFRDSGDWYEEVPLVGLDISRLRWDFLCVVGEELIFIEIQGSQHFRRNVKFQPKDDDFQNQLVRDELKALFADQNSKYGVVEFFEDDPPVTLEWFKKTYPEVAQIMSKKKG